LELRSRLPPYRRIWRGKLNATPRLGMAEIVNLRIARKRAARSKAEDRAAEQRLAHGVSKSERDRAAADRDRARQTVDQHRIETGDRR
jgi:DNA-binding helix-hairpin-helix protein with protein kinase domain